MKQFFIKKYIFTGIFLVSLFLFSALNLRKTFPELKAVLADSESYKNGAGGLIGAIETAINENILLKYYFIEGYGFVQKVLGKNETNNFEVVKDQQDFLYKANFSEGPYYAVDELAARVKRLQESAATSGCRVIILIPPVKEVDHSNEVDRGLPNNYFNDTADLYRDAANGYGVPVIDFRETEECGKIPESEWFFKTDHHWKIETAFAAFQDLVLTMDRNFDAGWDPEGFYTDPHNYNSIQYADCFLGFYGRKTGAVYSGVDDFTLIWPKFNTYFEYYYETGEKKEELKGKFEEVLMDTSYLSTNNIYLNDKYMCYLASLRSLDQISNPMKPEGDRVLFIRDSYTAPLAAFLSAVCSEVDMIYPLGYTGSIEEYVEQNKEKYDTIFVSIYPENMTLDFFSFYEEESGGVNP